MAVSAVSGVASGEPAQSSAAALATVRAESADPDGIAILDQIDVIMHAASTAEARARFIADPVAFAHSLGIEIDRGFARHMREEMRKVEAQAVAVIAQAGSQAAARVGSPAPSALPVVVAAAAVVSAAAAVVSAASLTYVATKWLPNATMR